MRLRYGSRHQPAASERSGDRKWCMGRTPPADRARALPILGPRNTVEDTPIVYPRNPTRLIGLHRLDGGPFIIGEFIAHDSSPSVWEFESQASG